MTETTEGTGAATEAGTGEGTGTSEGGAAPDYKAMYEASQADATKWKALSRKHEKQSQANADADKVAAERQDSLNKVLSALGLDTGGDKTPDVSAVTAQLQQAQAEGRARAVELAVLRAAGRNGADGDALLDSRSFLNSLKDVDPTDSAAIADAVKAAVAANNRYAAPGADTAGQGSNTGQQQAAQQRQASSVGEFNGAPGGQRQWTQADVDRATPKQLEKAIADNLLVNYLNS